MTSAPPIPGRAKALVAVVLLLDGLMAVPVIEGWRGGQLNHSILLFLLPFNVFALGWILEILARSTLGRSLEPEGLHFGRDGALEWAEFRRLGPLKFSLGILLAISFVLMFFSFRLPTSQFVRVWTMLLATWLILWLGKAAFNLRRPRRYRYSPASDLLQLPGGDSVSGTALALRIEEMRSPRPDKVRCRPVFSVQDSRGRHDVPLPWSFGRARSEQFRDWFNRCRDRGPAATSPSTPHPPSTPPPANA